MLGAQVGGLRPPTESSTREGQHFMVCDPRAVWRHFRRSLIVLNRWGGIPFPAEALPPRV